MSRQIPVETVFRSNGSNSWRDPLKPNRIHFRFPESWSNSICKDSIIGIRDIFITNAYRKAEITFRIRLICDLGTASTTLEDEEITIYKFFDNSVILKDYIIAINNKFKEEIESKFNTHFTDTDFTKGNLLRNTRKVFIYTDISEDRARLVIESPFNKLSEEDRTDKVDEFNYYITAEITNYNEDTNMLFNLDNIVEPESEGDFYYSYDIWDRRSCILNSNLSYVSDESYLGHTRKEPLPKIKYYNLTGTNKTFWIDLYSTCGHNTPVVLPRDGKDELFIEAQLLSSSQAVL